MKQTWKWAMMLFMAITLAVGTTSCSSDDDDDKGGNVPAELQGKWALVWDWISDADGEEEENYDPMHSDDYIRITESTLEHYENGKVAYEVEIGYKNGTLYRTDGEGSIAEIDDVTEQYIEWSYSYKYGGQTIKQRQRYQRLAKFPWE